MLILEGGLLRLLHWSDEAATTTVAAGGRAVAGQVATVGGFCCGGVHGVPLAALHQVPQDEDGGIVALRNRGGVGGGGAVGGVASSTHGGHGVALRSRSGVPRHLGGVGHAVEAACDSLRLAGRCRAPLTEATWTLKVLPQVRLLTEQAVLVVLQDSPPPPSADVTDTTKCSASLSASHDTVTSFDPQLTSELTF
ncbi:hypothetical protein EYF80_021976 [Liparis tanakae]|uniref:Uncharacterized protein n=1 Tax=Liparis tanakae TaxID=230148 RepID=A0A4Z2HSL5_9TELE|nr:hypothetical protein EYF80_021976 [Liparis tanakae]